MICKSCESDMSLEYDSVEEIGKQGTRIGVEIYFCNECGLKMRRFVGKYRNYDEYTNTRK